MDIEDMRISVGDYSSHPTEEGNYELFVSAGTYDLDAILHGFTPYTAEDMVCTPGANITLNINMEYLPPASELEYTLGDGVINLTWDYATPDMRTRNRQAGRVDAQRLSFQHFNVWRQVGCDVFEKIDSTLTDAQFSDLIQPTFHYRYYVTAVYDHGESDSSNIVEYPVGGQVPIQNNTVPAVTRLNGNYPNPFNPETTIAFSLARSGKVALKVYNLRGELVTTLVNDNRNAGDYAIRWNGRDQANRAVASGIYLYRLEANGSVWTRKAMLLK